MIKNKFEIIKKYIQGKDVLDCGCVGTFEFEKFHPDFLHPKLVKLAKSVWGVDTNASGAKQMKKLGFNVVVGNVENIELGRKFDVIVAGDLLEHLSNVGMFLDNTKKHLKPSGVLIIHTPNAFGITRFYHMLAKKGVEVNPDHICYYDIKTLKQLLERHGYSIIESHYTNTLNPPLIKKIIINFFTKISAGFADSILMVAKTREETNTNDNCVEA